MKLSIITATYNRAKILEAVALPSILEQADSDFEWVVINDGANPQTRLLIQQLRDDRVVYREMSHPTKGFGLCHARNMGLSVATGDLVCYLDDDNQFLPQFVAATKQFFLRNPWVKCSMAQQHRRRDVFQSGRLVRQGTSFIAPKATANHEDLITQRDLFDSNGFAHIRQDAPQWNPDYKVFADYQFFLQCLKSWGNESFKLHPSPLVNYVQSSEGIIGQSSYQDWAADLTQILCDLSNQAVLTQRNVESLNRLIQQWKDKQRGAGLKGFEPKGLH